ncbi:MAG: hypothetical protein AAFN10_00530 [Bacteroidota bacterium]
MIRPIFTLFLLVYGLSLWAQRPVIDRVKNRTKQQATQRAEQKANQAVDTGLDKLEEALFGKKDKAEAESSAAASEIPMTESDSVYVPPSGATPDSKPNPFSLGSKSQQAIEPFERGNFGTGTVPQGVIGKGPFGLASAKMIQKTYSQTLQSMTVEQYDTLTFVDFGMRSFRAQQQIQFVNMLGIKNKQLHQAHIYTLGDTIYNINPVARTGVKMLNPSQHIYEGMSEQEIREFAEQVEEGMNTRSERLGTDRVAGQVCEVFDFMTYDERDQLIFVSRVWFYKGVMLRSRSRGFGSEIEIETLYFEENPAVSNQLFRFDQNIQFSSFSFPFGQ